MRADAEFLYKTGKGGSTLVATNELSMEIMIYALMYSWLS